MEQVKIRAQYDNTPEGRELFVRAFELLAPMLKAQPKIQDRGNGRIDVYFFLVDPSNNYTAQKKKSTNDTEQRQSIDRKRKKC